MGGLFVLWLQHLKGARHRRRKGAPLLLVWTLVEGHERAFLERWFRVSTLQ